MLSGTSLWTKVTSGEYSIANIHRLINMFTNRKICCTWADSVMPKHFHLQKWKRLIWGFIFFSFLLKHFFKKSYEYYENTTVMFIPLFFFFWKCHFNTYLINYLTITFHKLLWKGQFIDDKRNSPSSHETYGICTGKRKFTCERLHF